MAPHSIQWDDRSTMTSRHSDTSEQSYRSYSTAPTEYSNTGRPPLPRYDTCYARVEGCSRDFARQPQPFQYEDARASVETYASTVISEGDEDDDYPEFEVPTYMPDEYASNSISATPRDFAALFPSTERMSISHDDSTPDGNMNLRVHTQVMMKSGRSRSVSLFHLRMYDLKNREFSLRRYSRDSGREVCHTVRKYQKPAIEKRNGLQRSFSSTLAFFHPQTRPQKTTEPSSGMRRSDSGYSSTSMKSHTFDDSYDQLPTQSRKTSVQLPTNTIKLEFSNYAHVDIKRRGGPKKRYEFDYWGTSYRWQRIAIQRGKIEEVSYHLMENGDDVPLAHIVPIPLTAAEADEEDEKGGWIPQCSMWMSRIMDDDLADIVVASGLIALVDDSIKRRFHEKQTKQLRIPLTRSGSLRMEYIGPKRLLADVFNRSTSGGHTSSRRTTPQHRHESDGRRWD